MMFRTLDDMILLKFCDMTFRRFDDMTLFGSYVTFIVHDVLQPDLESEKLQKLLKGFKQDHDVICFYFKYKALLLDLVKVL